jgi:hypothetical protein
VKCCSVAPYASWRLCVIFPLSRVSRGSRFKSCSLILFILSQFLFFDFSFPPPLFRYPRNYGLGSVPQAVTPVASFKIAGFGVFIFANESRGESIAAQYRTFGIRLGSATMDRISGWSAIAQRLGDDAAGIAPTMFFHPRCRRLLACLPCVQHDPDRPGDVLKSNITEDGTGGDDAADALRYLVSTHPHRLVVRKLKGFY